MTQVQIVEVAARDGLQNDPADLRTDQKIEIVARAYDAGVKRAEVASFVHPRLVPKMADGEAVARGLADRAGVSNIGLVLNVRGYERARVTPGIHEVNLVVASTDTFAQRNQNMTSDQTVDVVDEVAPLAATAGLKVSVTMSTAFGCPFEGEVPTERNVAMARRVAAIEGVSEIALADTIGVAVPEDVRRRVAAVRQVIGDIALRAHFHNTRNTGYANALAAVEVGVTVLDASLGGIGGCPFAPKATGNIATEDLVYLLHRSGYETGLDLDSLISASDWLGDQIGRPTPSLLSKAGVFPQSASVA
ncbi:MAG: hydroxymethylglutaryl-CoA lyase [Candidatus Nanopelagicales bacterium]